MSQLSTYMPELTPDQEQQLLQKRAGDEAAGAMRGMKGPTALLERQMAERTAYNARLGANALAKQKFDLAMATPNADIEGMAPGITEAAIRRQGGVDLQTLYNQAAGLHKQRQDTIGNDLARLNIPLAAWQRANGMGQATPANDDDLDVINAPVHLAGFKAPDWAQLTPEQRDATYLAPLRAARAKQREEDAALAKAMKEDQWLGINSKYALEAQQKFDRAQKMAKARLGNAPVGGENLQKLRGIYVQGDVTAAGSGETLSPAYGPREYDDARFSQDNPRMKAALQQEFQQRALALHDLAPATAERGKQIAAAGAAERRGVAPEEYQANITGQAQATRQGEAATKMTEAAAEAAPAMLAGQQAAAAGMAGNKSQERQAALLKQYADAREKIASSGGDTSQIDAQIKELLAPQQGPAQAGQGQGTQTTQTPQPPAAAKSWWQQMIPSWQDAAAAGFPGGGVIKRSVEGLSQSMPASGGPGAGVGGASVRAQAPASAPTANLYRDNAPALPAHARPLAPGETSYPGTGGRTYIQSGSRSEPAVMVNGDPYMPSRVAPPQGPREAAARAGVPGSPQPQGRKLEFTLDGKLFRQVGNVVYQVVPDGRGGETLVRTTVKPRAQA